MGSIHTTFDTYFDARCSYDDDSEDDDEDDYDRSYDRNEDEPSEEDRYGKYESRRRVKVHVTCKLNSFLFSNVRERLSLMV